MDMMNEALMRRRKKGLQLTILLDGEPVIEGQAQSSPNDSDLAPSPEKEKPELQEMAQEIPEMESQEPEMKDSEEGVPPEAGSKRFKSLGERAKAMNAKKGMS